ncbi:MAG TPA: methyl-accepting chemotaxis protein [Spirochaetota bacterium]|nr:methyl-accepting chemotaxis protein [Spirochaetota bacterium]HQA52925.1 methyl-accepting chemotaxis protein [Spirochaetota bacterium]
MEIDGIKSGMEEMDSLTKETISTAKDVNRNSRLRKTLTEESMGLLDKVIESSSSIKESFEVVRKNLSDSSNDVEDTIKDVKDSDYTITSVVSNLTNIKNDLNGIAREIQRLTMIVGEIKRDTDKIFTLALNASIVSSKYSSKSGVFDILANKLNEMSNFISQNLENIVKVVQPFTDGVKSLIDDNEAVLSDVTKGSEFFSEIPVILQSQRDSVMELVRKAEESASRIESQKVMLLDVKSRFITMGNDAVSAIEGSDNVRVFSEKLSDEIQEAKKALSFDLKFYNQTDAIKQKAVSIWKQATNVNEKSKSQLEFADQAVSFTADVISQAHSLKSFSEMFLNQSIQNKEVSNKISDKLLTMNTQLKEVSGRIGDANSTIQRFVNNYKQIDNILEFLKNILKSMHLIGMYSRIESARDIDVFEGFMNISANIGVLQKEIQNNIPNIEKNIFQTHQLINSVNGKFSTIHSDFANISNVSERIISELKVIINLSGESENTSKTVFDKSKEISVLLDQLLEKIKKLPEVTKIPVEGSAGNIERGKRMEAICAEIAQCLRYSI